MCRLLAYLGPPVSGHRLLYEPEHSLIAQSYQPREMRDALLNADGLGVGWYHPQRQEPPYIYKNTLPAWSDSNLPHLSRYLETHCLLGYVRSATPGLAVDLGNCQPFGRDRLLFVHNGYLENFRLSGLRRSLRHSLTPDAEDWIEGSTDSEYICALLLSLRQHAPELSLAHALAETMRQVATLTAAKSLDFTANIVLSTGRELVACRYVASGEPLSLYWLQNAPNFPQSLLLASEPLFPGDWQSVPAQSVLSASADQLQPCIEPI